MFDGSRRVCWRSRELIGAISQLIRDWGFGAMGLLMFMNSGSE